LPGTSSYSTRAALERAGGFLWSIPEGSFGDAACDSIVGGRHAGDLLIFMVSLAPILVFQEKSVKTKKSKDRPHGGLQQLSERVDFGSMGKLGAHADGWNCTIAGLF